MRTFAFFVFFLLPTILFSQNFVEVNLFGEVRGFTKAKASSEKEIDGNPYFNKNWLNGSVKLVGRNEQKVDSMRYNVYSNEIQFSYQDTIYFISNTKDIIYFTIGESKFIFYMYSHDNERRIFEVMSEGEKVILLKMYSCSIIEGKKSDGINPGTIDKFKISSDYYTIKNFQPAQEFRMKSDNLTELLTDKNDEVSKYIKDNKLKMKKEEDFIKVFNYYNSLN